jgi:hypothetical protein
MRSFAVLIASALALVAEPSNAQDKGKTAAAELTKESQAALAQLNATVALAKALTPTAHAVLVFPKVTKAGLGSGGQTAREPFSRAERRSPTTRRPALRSACRRAASNTAMPCSS